MIKRNVHALIATLCLFGVSQACVASELLFAKVSRNYDQEGALGRRLRGELETRMFTHSNWVQRLYYYSSDPDLNETLEIYSTPNGSHRLSYCRASPSLTGIIWRRFVGDEQFDLAKRLNEVRISCREVLLPEELAKELELLWETMLPGVEKEPRPQYLYTHVPIFIGFARENTSVKTGSICLAAYDTPVYREFVPIVNDLVALCEHKNDSADILRRLPSKIRHLRVRLGSHVDFRKSSRRE